MSFTSSGFLSFINKNSIMLCFFLSYQMIHHIFNIWKLTKSVLILTNKHTILITLILTVSPESASFFLAWDMVVILSPYFFSNFLVFATLKRKKLTIFSFWYICYFISIAYILLGPQLKTSILSMHIKEIDMKLITLIFANSEEVFFASNTVHLLWVLIFSLFALLCT